MPAPIRTRLEPLPAPVMAVALAHMLVVMLVWVVVPLWTEATRSETASVDLEWMAPAAFLPVPKPAPPPVTAVKRAPVPVKAPQKPTPPPTPAPAPKPPTAVTLAGSAPLRAANKYITLSPLVTEVAGPPAPPKPYRPVPSLLDIANANTTPDSGNRIDGIDMGAVDEAVQQTYLKEWVAPSTHLVPPGQRSAVLRVSIGKDGTILEATLSKTGAPALNVSISQAVQRVKKIPVSLPSSFRKPSYDLQVNFQIE